MQAEAPQIEVSFVHVNIMDRVSIEKAVKKIVDAVKHIDVLINGTDVVADKNVETTIGVNLVRRKMIAISLHFFEDGKK